jgi:hypothetical protein
MTFDGSIVPAAPRAKVHSAAAWSRSRARPAAVAAGLALAAALRHLHAAPSGADRRGAPENAIAEALRARGLACDAADVVWVDVPRRVSAAILGGARALVRAGTPGEPRDLYVVDARVSPEGAVLSVGSARDLTDTSGVDESRPMIRGHLALYTTADDGLVTGVHVLDLAGYGAESSAAFSHLQRLQSTLTNLQQTGQATGIGHTAFAFDPIARRASVEWRQDGIVVAHADDHDIIIDPERARVLAGEGFVRVVPDERAPPGSLVPWAVDRVRALPWFGDDRMQWIKAVAFMALDRVHLLESNHTTVDDVRNELGIEASTAPSRAEPSDPEIGWPPAPVKPPVSPPLPGEGQWIALDRDPFITPSPSGTGPAFVTTFLRPDPHRQDVRVYVTLWDPRQIELHVEAGTVEPISANGEHGPGLVPRTPEVMTHFVAAFNGGFQAQHGEYGMQADGVEYLPPKPYAATVVELRDGSSAFGAWPNSAEIPGDVVAFRQNLTALVQGGKYNPWGRTWWGGTPPGWPDQIHSTRSAICLTTDGFVGYFYSTSISADDLGQGMLAARCSFGIHLDMNPGHAGFEFYDVAPEGHLNPLSRPLQADWEAEGRVPDLPGYAFRARRMIRGMGHMLFPRYVHREARDFFYLTTRPLLPGPPIPRAPGVDDAVPGEGTWQTRGLPQRGFPYALATSFARLGPRTGDLKAFVLRADPKTMVPAPAAPLPDASTVLAVTASVRGSQTLFWSDRAFVLASRSPAADARALVGGHPLDDPRATGARAAVGIEDDDGLLVWVELAGDARANADTAAAMDALLARMGCSARMGVPGDAHALLGGTTDVAGHATPAGVTAVHLVRGPSADAHAIFADTPLVPIQVWQPLQAKRVRYFYKPAPSASAAPSRVGF